MMRLRALPLLLLLVAAAPRLEAQVRPIVQSTAERDQMLFNAEMMEDYQGLVRSWTAAMGRGDTRAAAALYHQSAVLVRQQGQVVHGREEIESALREMSSRWRNLRIGLLDFEASGSLLYGLGTYVYDEGVGADTESITGTYVLVLYRGGRTLRIRSQSFLAPGE